MAILNFPDTTGQPIDGSFTFEENGVLYSWDGYKWTANTEGGDAYWDRNGTTLEPANAGDDVDLGNIQLNADGSATFAGGLINLYSQGYIRSQRGDGSDISINGGTTNAWAVDYNGIATSTISHDGSASFAGDIQSTSQNGGPLAGFRNQIINGSLGIDQRYSNAVNGANDFVTDRWYVSSSTVSNINTDIATFPGQEFDRFVRIGNGSGANVFKQAIELPAPWVGGKAGAFTQGSTWTFSFYHDPSSAAPANPQFGFANNTGGSNAVAMNLDAFADVTGDTASGWQRKSVTFTVNISPNAGNLCAYIQFTGDNSFCTGFQLEPGPVATPFEHRPIGTELALCQRYYQNYVVLQHSASKISEAITASGALVCSMRAAATTAFTVHSGGNISLSGASDYTTAGQYSIAGTSNATGGTIAGTPAYAVRIDNVSFDAEL